MAPALQYRPKSFFGPGSVYVAPPSASGESGVRRLAIHKDALVTQPAPGIDTVSDIIAYAARTHGDRPAMGWRDIVRIHTEEKDVKKIVEGKETTEKKKWNYFEMSDYKFINYVELQEAVSEVARALVKLGIAPGDVVDIFAETRCVHPDVIIHSQLHSHPSQRQLADRVPRLRVDLCHNGDSL